MEPGEDTDSQRHIKKLMHNWSIKYQIMNLVFPKWIWTKPPREEHRNIKHNDVEEQEQMKESHE